MIPVCEHGIRWPWACNDCDLAVANKRASAAGREPDRASGGQPAPPEGQPPAGGDAAREADQ